MKREKGISMKKLLIFIWLGIAMQVSAAPVDAVNFKKWVVYPFSFEVPESLQPFSERERELFRSNYSSQNADYYKRYYQINDSQFSTAPYIAAFRTYDVGLTFVALVIRIPPQTDYLASITREFGAKMEWGKRQGIIKEIRISDPARIGDYDSVTMEFVNPDGRHGLTAMLYDDELPYQVIQLTLLASPIRAAEAPEAFDHILKTIKIDYTLHGMVGGQPFVISKRCQEFFVITEISNPEAKKIVFIIQEPHWDWRGHWNLHQGLRVFFDDNANLLGKSAFLSEGVRAMDQTSVAALTQAMQEPEPMLVKAMLESFLVTGYVTFNWMTGNRIPVIGTEDWLLYEESAHLWKSGENASWAVTVAARNEKMVEVLSQLQSRFPNPMLFVGGMHVHNIDKELFAKGQATLVATSPSSGKSNRGVKEWLKQKGIDFIYIEPLPDLSLRDDATAMARYRELFTAQLKGNYDAYIEKFAAGYLSRLAAGAYVDGVTVTPKPAEAAKLVAVLQKKSGGVEGSDKTYKGNNNQASGAVQRFKDALSKVNLRGKNLKSGRNAIRDADPNLLETRDDSGSHEWKEKNGRVRFRYHPKGAHNDAHWDKWAPDGTRIDNAGRPSLEHIPAK
jgi:hypothetical protein